MSTGCLILGVAVGVIVMFALASAGAEEYLLLLPSLALGGGVGLGVWVRAYRTGAMIEDDE